MAGRWLRNKKDGEIYGWNEILAENPLTEEVTEEQAFPEKFMTKEQKSRKPKVNLKTKNIPTKKVFPEIDNVEMKVKMMAKKSGQMHIKYMPSGSTILDIKTYIKELELTTK